MKNQALLLVGLFLAALLVQVALPVAASAAAPKPIGYVQQVRGEVTAVTEDAEVQKTLKTGPARFLYRDSPVYQQDMVVSAAQSRAQIMFRDGTILTIDENSQVKLDQFQYDFSAKDTNILKFIFGPGLFRFLTGKLVDRSPKAFDLQTPLGTIGIRGTDGGVEAPPQDPAAHADLVHQINGLAGASAEEQADAARLFAEAFAAAVANQKVYHFSGPTQRTMVFDDTVSKRTVFIPRGTFLMVSSRDGAGDPQNIPAGYHGLVPTINLTISAPTPLQGLYGGEGDTNKKEVDLNANPSGHYSDRDTERKGGGTPGDNGGPGYGDNGGGGGGGGGGDYSDTKPDSPDPW